MIEHKSYKTKRKAVLIGKNGTAEVVLKDLSLDSAGVLTQRGAKTGTELELVFEIPVRGEFKEISLDTAVTHRHNSEDEIYLKLGFVNLSPSNADAIEDYLDYKQRLIDMSIHKNTN